MSTLNRTIRTWALQEVVVHRPARRAVALIAFALATAFSAQIAVRLPWTAVPITMQPLVVILAGVVLGPRLGALSIASYVMVGAAGAPIFSNGGGGLPWLLGPTGGYLLAMPAAAFVAGLVAGPGRRAPRLAFGLLAGVLTIYAGGVSQLLLLTGQGFGAVLRMGVLPFLVGDATKVALAFFLTKPLRSTSLGRL